MGLEEKHEAPKDEGKRSREKRDTKPLWWLGQRDPVVRFTAWLAVFTGLLFIVTVGSTIALLRTDWTLHETLIAANRAWISPVRAELVKGVEDPEGPTVMIHYQNVGRSPALDVRVGMGPIAVDVERPVSTTREYPQTPLWEGLASVFKDTCSKNMPSPGMGAVYPSATTESNVPSRMTTAWNKDRLLNGTQIIVVAACFTYRTMEQVHHSGSCSFFFHENGKPTQIWETRSCPIGNFAD